MKVFKFGGASVKDAEAVMNVANIIDLFQEDLVIVVSAMGKTTNALEKVVNAFFSSNKKEAADLTADVIEYHRDIITQLGIKKDEFLNVIEDIFTKLKEKTEKESSSNFDYEYDQIVSFGEIISTTIISGYLTSIEKENNWFDARKIIRTNNKYREGEVDWETTKVQVHKTIGNYIEDPINQNIAITQGFIGHTDTGQTTTLGREGSDFSAAILAWCLNAQEVTIWKDVPGMLNADPKYFKDCKKLNSISYKEAIELSYYGASVIHPKTIKPLQNIGIPLFVKSFINPKKAGTEIQSSIENDALIPSYIFKKNQLLISISPKDFSFIAEDNLSDIFNIFSNFGIKINLMQNSAISFSVCVNNVSSRIEKLIATLSINYLVKYNESLELLTIRHYDEETINKLIQNKDVLVEQKSRHTARFVMKITEI